MILFKYMYIVFYARYAHYVSAASKKIRPFYAALSTLSLYISEFEKIQKEQPLELPPKPPQRRNWRGSMVAPFAGNNMLVLYSCPTESSSKYFVQVLHNEHPVPMPVSICYPFFAKCCRFQSSQVISLYFCLVSSIDAIW